MFFKIFFQQRAYLLYLIFIVIVTIELNNVMFSLTGKYLGRASAVCIPANANFSFNHKFFNVCSRLTNCLESLLQYYRLYNLHVY